MLCSYLKHKYTKFEPNILGVSRVISIYTNRARPAKMMHGESLVIVVHISGWTMLKYVRKENLNQIYHAVQEL